MLAVIVTASDPLAVVETKACSTTEGVCSICPADRARTSPPLSVNVPLTSNAPLPPLLVPNTVISPPLMVRFPLESMPSPCASIVTVPP